MGILSGYTKIELLKHINDINAQHDKLKDEIFNHSIQIDDLEKLINDKLNQLSDIESNYIILIEEYNKREE